MKSQLDIIDKDSWTKICNQLTIRQLSKLIKTCHFFRNFIGNADYNLLKNYQNSYFILDNDYSCNREIPSISKISIFWLEKMNKIPIGKNLARPFYEANYLDEYAFAKSIFNNELDRIKYCLKFYKFGQLSLQNIANNAKHSNSSLFTATQNIKKIVNNITSYKYADLMINCIILPLMLGFKDLTLKIIELYTSGEINISSFLLFKSNLDMIAEKSKHDDPFFNIRLDLDSVNQIKILKFDQILQIFNGYEIVEPLSKILGGISNGLSEKKRKAFLDKYSKKY